MAGPVFAAPMGTAFTYQGQLQRSGAPASGSFDFRFKLFDASSGGVQIGGDALRPSVAVSNGLFTVNLDFGATAFGGSARFLQIEVRPAGTGAYTLLTPRQEMKPQPHALYAANAATAANATNAATATNASNAAHATAADNATNAAHATNADNAANATHASNADNATTASYARKIPLAGTGATTAAARSDHNHFGNSWAGVTSSYGLEVDNSSGSGDGIRGYSGATAYNYAGVYAVCTSTGTGVYGSSAGGRGVYGTSTNGDGVEGTTTNGGKSGVWGHSTNGFGITGDSTNNVAVLARSTNGDGLEGTTTNGGKSGVYGHSTAGIGVTGISTNSYGVQGQSTNSYGVYGHATSNTATSYGGYFYSENYRALYASSASGYYAGYLVDRGGSTAPGLYVDGTIFASGSKAGYVVDIAVNDGSDSLETGDLVVIVGADTPVAGEIPLVKVRKCTQPQSAAVMGVVDQPFRVSNAEAGPEKEPPGPSAPTALAANGNAIATRQYLSVVTHGAFKTVKADVSGGPIRPGDLLVASPTAGRAMKASSPAPGTIIGKALGELAAGAGAIPVMVTLQ
jgi:hypothetical protein